MKKELKFHYVLAICASLFVPTDYFLAASEKQIAITILHTNDLHGHVTSWQGWEGDLAEMNVGGLDRIAAEVARVRKAVGAEKVLLLDAGDTLGDTLIAAKTDGRVIIESMNLIGYDAMVVGNHEVDFSAEVLRSRMAHATFPILAANITDENTKSLLSKPYVLKHVAGIKIGILGLAYPNTPYTTAKKNVVGLRFDDARAAAEHYVPLMRRDGAEVIVALTHLGLSADKQLAEHVNGIDVIVGGHSHNRMRDALVVNQTVIVQAGAHGSDLGRLDLELQRSADGYKISRHERNLITLSGERDPATAEFLARALTPYEAQRNETIGHARGTLIRAQTLGGDQPTPRDEESPVDDLFADALRESTGTDIALLPGVGYGVAIAKGPITADHLKNLIPHESDIVTMTLTGKQIKSILEQSIENFSTKNASQKVGGIIQVSGLRFSFDAKQAFGSRVRTVEISREPLQLDKRYTVTTNSLLAEGGHKYEDFNQGQDRQKLGKQYDLVSQWIRQRREVESPPTNRIQEL